MVKDYEAEIKQIKHQAYKLSWYMRGGVDAKDLLDNTDLEDIAILENIVKENIEFTKKTNMPVL